MILLIWIRTVPSSVVQRKWMGRSIRKWVPYHVHTDRNRDTVSHNALDDWDNRDDRPERMVYLRLAVVVAVAVDAMVPKGWDRQQWKIPYSWRKELVGNYRVVVESNIVVPPPCTRDVRGTPPPRIDQMLVHSTHNTKTPVTASALTKPCCTDLYIEIYIFVFAYTTINTNSKVMCSGSYVL